MKKEDLKSGNIVELRDGRRYIKTCVEGFEFIRLDYTSATSTAFFPLNEYDDDLKGSSRTFDIMKVYEDYTLKKVLWERKEYIVSLDEKVILRNLSKKYKWIVRQEDNTLYLYEEKPRKTKDCWISYVGNVEYLDIFNHLFEYIKWGDTKPILIEDLLKEM